MHLTQLPASRKLSALRGDVPYPGAVYWSLELCPATKIGAPCLAPCSQIQDRNLFAKQIMKN